VFHLEAADFAHIDPATGRWRVFPGRYDVRVGPDCMRGLSAEIAIDREPAIPPEALCEEPPAFC
jgi:hypothetical protein